MNLTTNDNPTYWLLGWLESNKVTSVDKVAELLRKPSQIREMRKVAGDWWEAVVDYVPDGVNLVAGTGLRLNDELTCPSPSCRRLQVDVLFRHAWHYFDRVLLPDGVGELLIYPPDNRTKEYIFETLLNRIDIVLHIQKLGALDLVYYYPRAKYLENDITPIVDEKQKRQWSKAWRDIEGVIISQGTYKFENLGQRQFKVEAIDPFLGIKHTHKFKLDRYERASEKRLRQKVAHKILHHHMIYLEEDIQIWRKLGSSFGSIIPSHEQVLTKICKMPDASEVLFHLYLPSFANVPISALIELRAIERESFETFRNSLTKAANEIIAQKKVNDPSKLSSEMYADIIQPEIARLNKKLKVAQKTLAKKSAASITLIVLSTTCGLLFGGPLGAVLGAVASGAGLGGVVLKYLDDKQTIELSDMYFLWKALEHAH